MFSNQLNITNINFKIKCRYSDNVWQFDGMSCNSQCMDWCCVEYIITYIKNLMNYCMIYVQVFENNSNLQQ